ncbi:MAG: class IV adenylate cyclase [candidate division KSB1 bacterium]|nr:class IV adenylate cyclase [candidate division KSB1 bacterium]MDZ7303357.1 class IV adenylate cyclase [candidate division KSB1 bacterium]MDZ7312325.1 class IV adenylate cyclase [candidate division KSB1 bacterium]
MTNLEFKARLRNPAAVRQVLTKFGIPLAATLRQKDTYFHVENGRLKLREIEGETAQLIFYRRPDQADVKRSDYHFAPVVSAAAVCEVLGAACGILTVVKKIRELYLLPRKLGQQVLTTPNFLTRLHLDTVESLGQFLEIEVIVHDGESPQLAEQEARAWLEEFDVESEDLIAGSYADLLKS